MGRLDRSNLASWYGRRDGSEMGAAVPEQAGSGRQNAAPLIRGFWVRSPRRPTPSDLAVSTHIYALVDLGCREGTARVRTLLPRRRRRDRLGRTGSGRVGRSGAADPGPGGAGWWCQRFVLRTAAAAARTSRVVASAVLTCRSCRTLNGTLGCRNCLNACLTSGSSCG